MKVYVVHICWHWNNKHEINAFRTLEKAEEFLRDALTNHTFLDDGKAVKSILRDNQELLTVDTVVRIVLHQKWYENDWEIKKQVYPFNIELLEREVL